MIIKYNGEEYMGIYLSLIERKGNVEYILFCWNLSKSYVDYIDFFDTEIIDGRLPPNMCINRRIEIDNKDRINEVSLSLEHNALYSESSWFWEALDDDDPKANLLFREIINEMKEFHGLPKDDLSEIEEEVRRQKLESCLHENTMTEEERRAKALENELEDYLKLGEEE